MATGRTVSRWLRFGVGDSINTPCEIPVTGLSPVGLVYGEQDVSAWQDAVMGFLAQQPTSAIEITGPFSTTAKVAFAATGVKPAMTGSHVVLSVIAATTFTDPIGLAIHFGIRGYWATNDPVFGIVAPSTTSGYVCSHYRTDGMTYTAKFQPRPGTTPAWGTSILTSGT